MKSKLILFTLATCLSIFIFNSCKKDTAQAALDSQTSQFNDDANTIKSENDQANSDITNSISASSFGGRVESSPACGLKMVDSNLVTKTLTFTFDGTTPCFDPTRTRSGVITVELTNGNYWIDANAVLTVTFINYKVTRLSDNHSVTFNGTKTLTNVNGATNWLGFWAGTAQITYHERMLGMNVTFEDGSQATWNSNRLTTYGYTPEIPSYNSRYVFTANGDTTINGTTNVDSWGTSRYNQPFVINFNSPWVANAYCGLWNPTGGDVIYNINNAKYELTLGVDQNGDPSTLQCAYGFKVSWTTAKGTTASIVVNY